MILIMLIYSYAVQMGLCPENTTSQLKMRKRKSGEVTQKAHRHVEMCSGLENNSLLCETVLRTAGHLVVSLPKPIHVNGVSSQAIIKYVLTDLQGTPQGTVPSLVQPVLPNGI